MSTEMIEIVQGAKHAHVIESAFPVWAARGWVRAQDAPAPEPAPEVPAPDPEPLDAPTDLHEVEEVAQESDVTGPRESIQDTEQGEE